MTNHIQEKIGRCELCNANPCTCLKRFKLHRPCLHKNTDYQPEEKDTNVPESYTCNECGNDLPIPEPDWDLLAKDMYDES